ncbi:MAG: dihydrolipoyllysine-residue acetyltransferase [Betaproteobacteria bacterium]|nr:dihydrolipoyllysine-residue acetyltransferase [Betaproteobacteria bacterium]MDH5219690.1 dihydrolipoyllysine-residue acetyltransferase [Betaproteobacteria bacterium]MDH5350743.1 dihydrolipoyllysine-residue acetyltransferase [Betaproteobacteria bacterium]
MREISVPDIGDFKDVAVIEVLVKAGDAVAPEQSLITVESDKATMEIPAPGAGVVKELRVKVGDKVSQGSPILVLEESGATPAAAKPAPPAAPVAVPPAPAAAGGPMTVKVPDIGDFKDVAVIEVLVKPGDAVSAEQSLITVESDKATMEIPAPGAGVVKELRVKVGDKVSEGSPILVLEGAAAGAARPALAAPAAPAPRSAEVPNLEATMPPRPPVPLEPQEATLSKPHASPSVRKFARELGVDLARVKGGGPKGRILHADVQAFVKGALAAVPAPAATARGGALPFNLPAWPDIDFAKFGPVEVKALTRLQKLSGPNLHRNWVSIPHVTQFDEADITELEAFRKSNTADTEKQGFKLTMLAFLIRACVTALRQHPLFNASLDRSGENLVIKKYYNIGVAVDTPEGLVVPVVRDADRKGVFDVARELGEISKLARDKKLKPGDLQGGTFSISSLGGIGGTAFTPIINAPEVAILGVSRSVLRPVWNGKEFTPRLMLPLSLSYDHRVIDGAAAARFTSYLASVLADIRRSLL